MKSESDKSVSGTMAAGSRGMASPADSDPHIRGWGKLEYPIIAGPRMDGHRLRNAAVMSAHQVLAKLSSNLRPMTLCSVEPEL